MVGNVPVDTYTKIDQALEHLKMKIKVNADQIENFYLRLSKLECEFKHLKEGSIADLESQNILANKVTGLNDSFNNLESELKNLYDDTIMNFETQKTAISDIFSQSTFFKKSIQDFQREFPDLKEKLSQGSCFCSTDRNPLISEMAQLF